MSSGLTLVAPRASLPASIANLRARSRASPDLYSHPLRGGVMTSFGPPESAARTGMPAASASIIAIENGSCSEDMTRQSISPRRPLADACSPFQATRFSRPSSCVRLRSDAAQRDDNADPSVPPICVKLNRIRVPSGTAARASRIRSQRFHGTKAPTPPSRTTRESAPPRAMVDENSVGMQGGMHCCHVPSPQP